MVGQDKYRSIDKSTVTELKVVDNNFVALFVKAVLFRISRLSAKLSVSIVQNMKKMKDSAAKKGIATVTNIVAEKEC